MSYPFARVYYYETNGDGHLSFDGLAASQGDNFRTATLEDLEAHRGGEPWISNVILHVDDGFFFWNNTYDGLQCVNDLLDAVLNRLEYVEKQDAPIYEELIGLKDFEVHKWLDTTDYRGLLGIGY